MAIFWGMGSKAKNPGELSLPYWCSFCQSFSEFSVTEHYKYGQVYGIRIAKYKEKHFLVCQKCDRVVVIPTKENYLKAQEISRSIRAEIGAGNMEINYMKYIGDVARFVLDNSELADAIENGAIDDGETSTKAADSKELLSENMKICPDCAEQVKAAAKKCRFCGSVFES